MNQHEKLSKFFRTFKGEEAGRKFVFLLMGRSGVGKSSAINTLLGEDIVPVGDYEPTTMEIGFYDADLNGNPCQVIDTPGLCDELEGVGNDQKYLDRIRSQIKQFDLMWFVSCLNDTRVQLGDKRGIKLISEALGSKIWEHSLIVLTFANNIDSPEERYGETLQKRTELLRKEIAKYTGTSIADSIPVVAVDNKKETTPDGEKWLGELYSEVLLRMVGDARAPYIMAAIPALRRLF